MTAADGAAALPSGPGATNSENPYGDAELFLFCSERNGGFKHIFVGCCSITPSPLVQLTGYDPASESLVPLNVEPGEDSESLPALTLPDPELHWPVDAIEAVTVVGPGGGDGEEGGDGGAEGDGRSNCFVYFSGKKDGPLMRHLYRVKLPPAEDLVKMLDEAGAEGGAVGVDSGAKGLTDLRIERLTTRKGGVVGRSNTVRSLVVQRPDEEWD